ncbi:hypothetical protein PSN45_001759 [Yamadazyma tenuis]|uniref:Uncharacterized protein n=1 Tax=Candida tenuis (strain ATCC 10573 / BCRC 21748 / CBS 615 / JCM 9827 / NBRC 10315 / NRRL Y-1498 / VKM Y-70) TaxID=590646 RepID=G3BE87_CANTC|nr:uncharacterized protein CANTEDRAFT_116538 [Yamadazyma tenuis ATCC 10573]EGV60488.1 hypothetical protein CANTEDRAFT_116538 [Yamadazyma tenuis ATCC 10573]WEJ94275.1 hypothetical protein PSN45_001759 [Yamadazyma tenuis]
MFEDYCSSHGKQCIPGSIYCSEECRIQDWEENFHFESDSEPEDAQPERPAQYSLMYECPVCQSTTACVHYNLHLNNNIILDTLKDIEVSSNMDSNYIKSNYYKWLINSAAVH